MQAGTWAPLGRTSVKVTTMSFGGAPIGNFLNPISEDDARQLVDQAWDLGVRFFDTAPLYGHGLSEHRTGSFLRQHERSSYVLASKAGRVLHPADPATFDSGLWASPAPFRASYDYSYDGVMRAVEDSLQRLLTDHLDTVFMHDVDRYTHGPDQPRMFRQAVEEGFPALVSLRDQGVVSAIGFGVNEADVLREAVEQTDSDCALLAGRYTLLEQDPLDDLLPLCEQRRIGVVLGGVYNSGVLATGPVPGAKFNYAPAPEQILDRARQLQQVCEKHAIPLPAAALQFAAAHPAVASICIGSRRTSQQSASAEFLKLPIPDALWEDLREAGLLREDAPVPTGSTK